MSLPVDVRVRTLLAEAAALLDRGLFREAADIFGRVLLSDRDHTEARSGLERAQSSLAEGQRRTEARIQEAQEALRVGETATVRAILDELAQEGDDLQEAQALLDRLDGRVGRVESAAPALVPGPAAPRGGPKGAPLSRQALVAVWTLAFVTLAVGLAFSWDRLVDRLVSNPAPASASISTLAPEPEMTAGEIAVSRARELAARGDFKTALVILEEVSPQDAEYPFARRLRAQVLAALPLEKRSAW